MVILAYSTPALARETLGVWCQVELRDLVALQRCLFSFFATWPSFRSSKAAIDSPTRERADMMSFFALKVNKSMA